MSGTFLYIIAAINAVILIGIIKVFVEMKAGKFNEASSNGSSTAAGS